MQTFTKNINAFKTYRNAQMFKKVMQILMHKQIRQIRVHKVNAFSIKFLQHNSYDKRHLIHTNGVHRDLYINIDI